MNLKEAIKKVPPLVWVALSLVGIWIAWFYIIPFIKGVFINAGATADSLATGQTATLTADQATAIASAIYGDEHTFWLNDNSDVLAQFQKMTNDADFDLVKGKFGVKTWGFIGFSTTGDMVQFIQANYSADTIASIDQILTSKNIQNQI